MGTHAERYELRDPSPQPIEAETSPVGVVRTDLATVAGRTEQRVVGPPPAAGRVLPRPTDVRR